VKTTEIAGRDGHTNQPSISLDTSPRVCFPGEKIWMDRSVAHFHLQDNFALLQVENNPHLGVQPGSGLLQPCWQEDLRRTATRSQEQHWLLWMNAVSDHGVAEVFK
jgi:hypothetical protein